MRDTGSLTAGRQVARPALSLHTVLLSLLGVLVTVGVSVTRLDSAVSLGTSAVIVIVAAVVIVGARVDPLELMIATVPIAVYVGGASRVNVSPADVFLLVLLAYAVLDLSRVGIRAPVARVLRYLVLYVVALLAVVAVGLVVTEAAHDAVWSAWVAGAFKLVVCVVYVGASFVAVSASLQRGDYRFLGVWAWVACIVALLGVAESLLYDVGIDFGLTKSYRAIATFEDPNSFASYLLGSAGVAMAWAYVRRGRLLTWMLVPLSVGVYFSYSRGGYIAYGCLLLLCGLLSIRQRAFAGFRWIAVAGALVMAFAATWGIWGYITDARRQVPISGDVRFRLWDAAVHFWASSPVVGVGLGQFPHLGQQYLGGSGELLVHNTYLSFLAEGGVLGVAVFLSVFAVVLVLLWRRRSAVASALAVGLLGVLVMAAGLNLQNFRPLWLLVGIGLAWSLAPRRRVHDGDADGREVDLPLPGDPADASPGDRDGAEAAGGRAAAPAFRAASTARAQTLRPRFFAAPSFSTLARASWGVEGSSPEKSGPEESTAEDSSVEAHGHDQRARADDAAPRTAPSLFVRTSAAHDAAARRPKTHGGIDAPEPDRRNRTPRRPFYARWSLWVPLVAVVAVGGAALLVALCVPKALGAARDLEAAQPFVTRVQSAIVAGDTSAAQRDGKQLAAVTASAVAQTDGPVWQMAEWIPWAGANLSAVRTTAEQAHAVATDVVDPLTTASIGALAPDRGSISLAGVRALAGPVHSADTAMTDAAARLRGIDAGWLVGPVRSGVERFRSSVDDVQPQLNALDSGLRVLPGMLGADGARTYLIDIQNNSELRPGGGTTGSLALVTADRGRIGLAKQASPATTDMPRYSTSVVPLPPGSPYASSTQLGRAAQDLTTTPDTALSFDIAQQMWTRAEGGRIDGFISLDAVTVRDVLAVTGPVTLSGGMTIDAGNAEDMMFGDLYTRYSATQVDAINQQFAAALFSRIASGGANPGRLIAALATAAGQDRVHVWTSQGDEQKVLKASTLGSLLPRSSASTDDFGVYFHGQDGKMDRYLTRSVRLAQGTCGTDDARHASVTVSLANTVTEAKVKQLPFYVTGPGTLVPKGVLRTLVYVYVPHGATVASATVDGTTVTPTTSTDHGMPVALVQTTLKPGEHHTVSIDVVMPGTTSKHLAATVTPGIGDTPVTTGNYRCTSSR